MDITMHKREFDELKVVAEKQESRVRYHETRAGRIAMAYLISSERFLLAFGMYHYQMSRSHRSWILLGFDLCRNLLYILFFLEAVIMLYLAENDLDIIYRTLDRISQHILNQVTNIPDDGHRLESGDSISGGPGFGFSFRLLELEYRPYRILHRKLYFASVLCAFLAVTAFQIYITYFNYYSPCN